MRTPEYAKSIHGGYGHFYKNSLISNFKSACLDNCLNVNAISTKNLTQVDKNCVKECIIHSIKLYHSSSVFTMKQQSRHRQGEDQVLLDYKL